MFTVLHSILLAGFVGVTSLLLAVTVGHRLRMRQVLLAWPTGRFFGVPGWPAAFLVTVVLFMIWAPLDDRTVTPFLFAGYLVGGVFWLVSVWLASSVVVTRFGLGRHRWSLAWDQVSDYFTVTRGRRQVYVFLYGDARGRQRRFELAVPARHRARFEHIVRARLDARIGPGAPQATGKKALEG